LKAARLCLLSAVVAIASHASAALAQGLGIVPAAPPECGIPAPVLFANSAVTPLADGGLVGSTILVSGAGPYLWDVGVRTGLTHSRSSELSVTLTSPSGTVVTLTSGNGGNNADVFDGTVWDDQADPGGQVPYASEAGLVTDHAYANGVTATPLVPEESLGAFQGEDPNGFWTLTVADSTAGHTGTLDGWSLAIAALPSPPVVFEHLSPMPSGPAAIPDNGTLISTVVVPGGIGSHVCRIEVDTSIDHPSSGQLQMTLQSPAGRIVTLTTNNGGVGSNAFAATRWDDRANPGGFLPYATNNGLATDQAYVAGISATPLVPEESLAAFDGENPAGTWTLTIHDGASGATGTLQSWTLHLTTCSCAQSFPVGPLRVDEHAGVTESNVNGVLEVGETALVETSWANESATPFSLVTSAGNFDGPGHATYTLVDRGAAYGTVAPFSTSNCFEATGDCYRVRVTGPRSSQHWDATFDEIAAPIALQAPGTQPYFATWMIHIGGSFVDVPSTNPFYRYIETIFHRGVTNGGACGGYCPNGQTLRKQMAVFLLKSLDGPTYAPPAATGLFIDVPASDPFAPWIEELYRRGIAAGCGSGPSYCPDKVVARQQMAAFLLKAKLGAAYVPPPATGLFSDVPVGSPFAAWIEDLAARGISGGCGPSFFCPLAPNTRGQMAVFLTKTFDLSLNAP